MAKKKKGPRQMFRLKCSACSSFNYITERNKVNTESKLELNKFCNICRTATKHTEAKKLK